MNRGNIGVIRLGPGKERQRELAAQGEEAIANLVNFLETHAMHYRNGRVAANGDKIIQLSGYGDGAQIASVGVLYDAKPGNDYCNGSMAPIQNTITGACLCDCLHIDDLAAILKEKGLDKRPTGK